MVRRFPGGLKPALHPNLTIGRELYANAFKHNNLAGRPEIVGCGICGWKGANVNRHKVCPNCGSDNFTATGPLS